MCIEEREIWERVAPARFKFQQSTWTWRYFFFFFKLPIFSRHFIFWNFFDYFELATIFQTLAGGW
jgi:hypothetical protein